MPELKSTFMNEDQRPNDDEVKETVGSTAPLWFGLIDYLNQQLGATGQEWTWYKKVGWSSYVIKKKRRIVYLLPSDGYFTASFVFGGKAVQAINESSLPKEIIDEMNDAPKYGEGRPLRVQVHDEKDLQHVQTLSQIKLKN
jgi:hypothetical protein